MSNKLSNYVKISALALLTATSCVALSERPAQAGPFDFLNQINNTVREVNGTVNGIKNTGAETNSAIGNLTDLLGVGKSAAPAPGAATGAAPVDSAAQVNGAYASWYKAMSPAEKEIANALTSEYAEKGTLSFADFKASSLFKAAKTSQEKQAASALFFKYSEVVKVAAPQKEKFLAFAFCVNGGSTTCK